VALESSYVDLNVFRIPTSEDVAVIALLMEKIFSRDVNLTAGVNRCI
jgi:hypothetical protein